MDLELISANQNQREAFSSNELDESRTRLKDLLSCQQDLDEIWRLSRWLVPVINCAKDKNYSGISLKSFQSNDRSKPRAMSSIDEKSNDSFDLMFYLPSMHSNRYLTVRCRLEATMKIEQILHLIKQKKQFQQSLLKTVSTLELVYLSFNDEKSLIDENQSAGDLRNQLEQQPGQLILYPKSFQPINMKRDILEL